MKLPCVLKILGNVFMYIVVIDGQCTLPTLLNGNWWDSRTGSVSVTQSSGVLAGWSVTAYSTTLSSYTCTQSDSSYWLFKSDSTLVAFSVTVYAYYCIKYTKITDYSYSYYLYTDVQPNANNVRIAMRDSTLTPSISDICNPTSGPSTEEFSVLVAENKQADVKQWFPDSLLGVYAYTVTDKSSTVSCGADTVWDACTNRTTMTLNYTQCNTQLFGSTGGELYATKYVTAGSTSFVLIINGDSSTSTRFTCLAVSGSTVVSNPGSCATGQNTSYHTADAASLKISLSAYETCPFSTDDSSSSSSIGIIIAVVVVVLLIAIAVVVAILYFKPLPCQKSKVGNGSAENAEKPPPPGSAVEPISPRVAVDINPTSETRNTALPPLPKPTTAVDLSNREPLPSITRQ